MSAASPPNSDLFDPQSYSALEVKILEAFGQIPSARGSADEIAAQYLRIKNVDQVAKAAARLCEIGLIGCIGSGRSMIFYSTNIELVAAVLQKIRPEKK